MYFISFGVVNQWGMRMFQGGSDYEGPKKSPAVIQNWF